MTKYKLVITALLLAAVSCSGVTRQDFTNPEESLLSAKILSYAATAPSSHNTQPWTVKILSEKHWIIGWDKTRALPAVDPDNRELIISVGAFCEAVRIAAGQFGLKAEIKPAAKTNFDDTIAEIFFTENNFSSSDDNEAAFLAKRRTMRKNLSKTPLSSNDSDYLRTGINSGLYFIANGSPEAAIIENAVLESNIAQAYNKSAASELAEWIRWSNSDAKAHRDGLTPASMEIDGFAGLFVRNFYSKEDVLKKSFSDASVDSVRKALSSYGCWILITSKDSHPSDLLLSGGDFLRLGINACKKNIGIHPMTQPLEEKGFQEVLCSKLKINGKIQFILRSGYVEKYPEPVSLRRNPRDILR